MGKGSGSTSSSTSSQPPQWVQDNLQGLYTQAQNVTGQPLNQYSSPLVAGFNDTQNSAMNTVNQTQGISVPYTNTAAQYAAQGAAPVFGQVQQFSPSSVSEYQSPYTQQVVNATQAQLNQNDQVQQQQLEGNAIASGASPFGGDRAGVAAAALAGQQDLANNQTIANLNNQGYTQALGELNNQQQLQLSGLNSDAWRAAGAAPTVAGLGTTAQNNALSGASAQLQSGALGQQLEQEQLNIPYEQYQQQMAYPYQNLSALESAAGLTGSLAGGTSTSTPASPSPFSQLAGLGTAGLGVYGAATGNKAGGIVGYASGGGIPDVSTSFITSGPSGQTFKSSIPIAPSTSSSSSQQQGTGLGSNGLNLGNMKAAGKGLNSIWNGPTMSADDAQAYNAMNGLTPGSADFATAGDTSGGLSDMLGFGASGSSVPESMVGQSLASTGAGDGVASAIGGSGMAGAEGVGSGLTGEFAAGLGGGAADSLSGMGAMGAADLLGGGATAGSLGGIGAMGATDLLGSAALDAGLGAGVEAGAGEGLAELLPFLLLAKKGGAMHYADGGSSASGSSAPPTFLAPLSEPGGISMPQLNINALNGSNKSALPTSPDLAQKTGSTTIPTPTAASAAPASTTSPLSATSLEQSFGMGGPSGTSSIGYNPWSAGSGLWYLDASGQPLAPAAGATTPTNQLPYMKKGGIADFDAGGVADATAQDPLQQGLQGANPNIQQAYQKLLTMPEQQLQEMAVQQQPNTPQGQMVQRALQAKKMMPAQQAPQQGIGAAASAMPQRSMMKKGGLARFDAAGTVNPDDVGEDTLSSIAGAKGLPPEQLMAESGNQDYNDDGTPVTSSAGALYSHQVMPSTAKKPGFGIKPAADDSPEEYNRVGDDYHDAMAKKFNGNQQLMAIAYNAGPSVAEAIQNKDQDINDIPAETKNYLANMGIPLSQSDQQGLGIKDIQSQFDPDSQVDHSGDTVKVNYPSEGKSFDTGLPSDSDAQSKQSVLTARDKNFDKWSPLIAAGLGMMAGTSPFAGVNIGKGGLEGLKNYSDIRTQQREEQQQAQQAQYQKGELANQTAERQKPIPDGMGGFLIPNPNDPTHPGRIAGPFDQIKKTDTNGQPLTGDALLANAPPQVADLARQIGEYKIAVTPYMRTKGDAITKAALAIVPQAYPDWNERNFGAITKFNTDPNGGVKVKSLNTVAPHLQMLSDLTDAMNTGDTKAINAIQNSFQTEFGLNAAPGNLQAASQLVGNEIINSTMAQGRSAGALGDREEVAKNLNGATSPKLLKDKIDNVYKPAIRAQANSLEQYYQSNTGQHDFQSRLLPDTRKILGYSTAQKLSPTTSAAANTSAIPSLPKGVPAGAQYSPKRNQWRANGQMYDANGNPV